MSSSRQKDKRRAYEKGRYANPLIRAKILEKNRKYRQLRRHDFMLREKFGITESDYQRILESQNGVCAICKQPERRVRQGKLLKLSVDHCHVTGKVRGLLCAVCNIGLGLMQDNPLFLTSAIEYLNANRID